MTDIRVVLADDHQIVREGLRLILDRHESIQVVAEAHNGRTAVDLARQTRPDIVVMDIAMADLNGIEATRQILHDNPAVKVVGLSAYADRRYVVGMMEAGASGYVLKANAGEELVRAIRAAIAGNIYLTPEVAGTAPAGQTEVYGPGATQNVLSPRESEVLQLLAEGKSSKEIAAALHISVRTADTHRRNIVRKLNLHSVAELTKYAIREGLTQLMP
jgi:DNA-binding NarL/FixJ family response regulator